MRREALQDKTVAQIVTDNISAAQIFKKHGIDFCCGGGITVAKACEINGVSIEVLVKELLANKSVHPNETDYNQWSLDELIHRIKDTHHHYIRTNIPHLIQYAEKVCAAHGDKYPHLYEIKNILNETSTNLLEHLKKEEEVIFPTIAKLLSVSHSKEKNDSWEAVTTSLSEIHEEHDEAGEAFKKISQLTNNYKPPSDACNTYKAFYHLLDEFENDLHLHVHLENNILFPKAQLLSKQQ